MELLARATTVEQIASMRDMYRQEMGCQIIHDSLHSRPGWTQAYLLTADGATAGYGSVVSGGPWKGRPTLFEWYVLPPHRSRAFDLFSALLAAGSPVMIETQSNDPFLTVMLHALAHDVKSESILFHDELTTAHSPYGAVFRRPEPEEAARLFPDSRASAVLGIVEVEGTVAATGGILFHYNRPYGDIYMEVAEPFRRRGLGTYIVQELKRVCYELGSVPSARCNPANIASRKTLQKAGFVPCAHILTGSLS